MTRLQCYSNILLELLSTILVKPLLVLKPLPLPMLAWSVKVLRGPNKKNIQLLPPQSIWMKLVKCLFPPPKKRKLLKVIITLLQLRSMSLILPVTVLAFLASSRDLVQQSVFLSTHSQSPLQIKIIPESILARARMIVALIEILGRALHVPLVCPVPYTLWYQILVYLYNLQLSTCCLLLSSAPTMQQQQLEGDQLQLQLQQQLVPYNTNNKTAKNLNLNLNLNQNNRNNRNINTIVTTANWRNVFYRTTSNNTNFFTSTCKVWDLTSHTLNTNFIARSILAKQNEVCNVESQSTVKTDSEVSVPCDTNQDTELASWFNEFETMDDFVEVTQDEKTEQLARVPKITFKSLQEFLDSLENDSAQNSHQCQQLSSPCPFTHTFNRPVAQPRAVVKPTWYVYGNSLNTEFFENNIQDATCGDIIVDHFEPLVQDPEFFQLSSGGRRILETPNAGGNSVWSEVLSYEVLHNVFGAQLKKTETEIQYVSGSKITDFSVDIQGKHIGVSVVRIINFFDLDGRTFKRVFTPEYARNLLYKKLFGVIASSEATFDRWEKQILHVWTTSSCVADTIVEEYWKIPSQLRSNTLVYVTHATNSEYLF